MAWGVVHHRQLRHHQPLPVPPCGPAWVWGQQRSQRRQHHPRLRCSGHRRCGRAGSGVVHLRWPCTRWCVSARRIGVCVRTQLLTNAPVCCMWPLWQALWVSRWQRVSMPAALIRLCWWRHCHQVGSLTSASRQPTALSRPWLVAVRSLRTAHARWHVRTTKVPCSAWRSSTRRRS